MRDVFISYKSEEFDDANWVRTILETNGISCWMAPASIPGGSSYAVEIPQAIRHAKVFVLILSSKAQLSKWVSKEVDLAINEGKIVLPFMLEHCDLKDDFNFYLTNVQRYAAFENKSAAIEKMVREIKAVLGTNDAPMPDESQKPQTKQKTLSPAPIKEPAPSEKTAAVAVNKEKPKQDEKPADASTSREPTAVRKKDAVKKVKPISRQKPKVPNNKRKKAIVFSSIGAALVVFVISIILIINLSIIEIAGEKVSVGENSFSFNNITFTDADLLSFEKIKEINYLSFSNCSIETDEIYTIVNRVNGTVKFDNCSLTDADIEKFDFSNSTVTTVSLNDNKEITDLSCLADTGEKLYSLCFNNCSVESIDFLKDCTGLTLLEASGNKISDISPLSGLSRLNSINLADNEVSSLEALVALKEISRINVNNNNLKSLNGLENALKLTEIYAANNQIEALDGIANATVLYAVDFSNNKITDISLLQKSKEKLTKINLSGNQLSADSSLEGCVSVKELNIADTGVSSLDFIADLRNLTDLYASNNQISDVSVLSDFKSLVNIDLSNNSIVDIVLPLFINDVTLLDFSHNNITSLHLPPNKYRSLKLYGNSISDLSCLTELSGSTVVFDYSADTDYNSLGGSGFASYVIFDCPLDRQLEIDKALGYRVEFTTENDYLAKLSAND